MKLPELFIFKVIHLCLHIHITHILSVILSQFLNKVTTAHMNKTYYVFLN